MSSLQRVTKNPILIPHLIKNSAVFYENHFTVIDVGVRGGVEQYFNAFGRHLKVIGFDADKVESDRLNSGSLDQRVKILPYGIGYKRVSSLDQNLDRQELVEVEKELMKSKSF